jgi:hypothetical protein
VGPLKWGVGKLVANAERTPLVVPIYHTGTNDIMPQSRDNELIDSLPVWSGVEITIQPGDPVPVADLIAAYHHHARQRALARNKRREAELARRREWGGGWPRGDGRSGAGDASPPATAGGETGWSWWNPASWWRGGASASPAGGSGGGAAGASNPRPAGSGPLALALPPPRPAGLPLEPSNTVEAAADHTGASAHVAGLATPVSAAQLEREAAMQAAGGADDIDAELTKLWAAKARQLASAASNMAAEVAAEVGEVADEVKAEAAAAVDKATHRAADIKARAAELIDRLRRTAGEGSGGAGGAPHPPAAPPGPDGTPAARDVDPLTPAERWRSSVSVPEPPRKVLPVPVPTPADAPAAAAAPQPAVAATASAPPQSTAAASNGPRRIPAGREGGDTLAVVLSEAPVVEVVPTRTLRTGALVPQFIDAPLRIKPPDHEYLTPGEAAEEEAIRLQLYSDIATRVHDCLAVLERQVFARRRARGLVEARPLETFSHPHGPTDDALAADTAAVSAALRERIAAWGVAGAGSAGGDGRLR